MNQRDSFNGEHVDLTTPLWTIFFVFFSVELLSSIALIMDAKEQYRINNCHFPNEKQDEARLDANASDFVKKIVQVASKNVVESNVLPKEQVKLLHDRLQEIKQRNNSRRRDHVKHWKLPLEERKAIRKAKSLSILESQIFSRILPHIGFTIPLKKHGTMIVQYVSAVQLVLSIIVPESMFHDRSLFFWSSFIRLYVSQLTPVSSLSWHE